MIGLVILGHGSNLPDYRRTVEMHRERLEKLGIFGEVKTAYVIEDPKLTDVLRDMRSEKVLVVPLFIAYGEHLREIEKALSEFGDKVVICDPIGESELVTYAILISALRRINVLSFE
ncbi:sirohydrochlorin chelatase [Archaeoglobus sp.]